MRRSGSSSCMLRPRSSLSDAELYSSVPPPSITLVNTKRMSNYCPERYYVLSELEMHSNSVRFLCDYDDDDDGDGGGIYSKHELRRSAMVGTTPVGAKDGRGAVPPRNVILYLLWRGGRAIGDVHDRGDGENEGDGEGDGDGDGESEDDPRVFAEKVIVESLRRLIHLRGGDVSVLDRGEDDCGGPGARAAAAAATPGGGGDGAGWGDGGYGWPGSGSCILTPPASPMASQIRRSASASASASASLLRCCSPPPLTSPTPPRLLPLPASSPLASATSSTVAKVSSVGNVAILPTLIEPGPADTSPTSSSSSSAAAAFEVRACANSEADEAEEEDELQAGEKTTKSSSSAAPAATAEEEASATSASRPSSTPTSIRGARKGNFMAPAYSPYSYAASLPPPHAPLASTLEAEEAAPTASPPPPPLSSPLPPISPSPLLRRTSSTSAMLRRSLSAVFREQEEAMRDRTRTRVYIAVDRLSPPPPPPPRPPLPKRQQRRQRWRQQQQQHYPSTTKEWSDADRKEEQERGVRGGKDESSSLSLSSPLPMRSETNGTLGKCTKWTFTTEEAERSTSNDGERSRLCLSGPDGTSGKIDGGVDPDDDDDDDNDNDEGAPSSDDDNDDDDLHSRIARHHKSEISLAETLAKYVASSKRLRPIVDGICVGICPTSVTAASPALGEALRVVLSHAPERRAEARVLCSPWSRLFSLAAASSSSSLPSSSYRGKTMGGETMGGGRGSGSGPGPGDDCDAGSDVVDMLKSAVGLVALHPDDLVCESLGQADRRYQVDAPPPDAAQGVLQSITVAEWGGNGDAACFARRAMSYWRERNGLLPLAEGGSTTDGGTSDGIGGGSGGTEIGADAADGNLLGSARRGRKRGGGRGRTSAGRGDGSGETWGVEDSEEVATTMVVAFVVFVVSYLWSMYGEQISALVMKKL